jgi:hypothetical protein
VEKLVLLKTQSRVYVHYPEKLLHEPLRDNLSASPVVYNAIATAPTRAASAPLR